MPSRSKISLVVIGRNSLPILSEIYSDKYILELRNQVDEFIYIDSASTDKSQLLMQNLGFTVFKLGVGGALNASAGRYFGTLQAKGQFILYLDSDMKLEDPSLLANQLPKLTDDRFVGIVGSVIDHTPDGKQRIRIRKSGKNGEAKSFGGALLIKRSAIIDAGNWNPSMYANEELELHARLHKAGSHILYFADLKIQHLTGDQSTPLQQLASLYFPWRNPVRYGAFGRAVSASIEARSFLYLARLAPEVFILICLLLVILSEVGLFANLVLFSLYEGILLSRRSWKFNAVVPGMLLAMPYGMLTYKSQSVKES